jgi:hypothetical protein
MDIAPNPYCVELFCSWQQWQVMVALREVYTKGQWKLPFDTTTDKDMTRKWLISCKDWNLEDAEHFCYVINVMFPDISIKLMNYETKEILKQTNT